LTEPTCDVGSGDVFVGVSSRVADRVKWGFGWSPMMSQVCGPTAEGPDRIEHGIRVGGVTEIHHGHHSFGQCM